MNAYANMSAPPRSNVHVATHPVGKQIVFNMQYAGLDPRLEEHQTMQEKAVLAQEWIADFARKHKAELDAVSRPMGYMVGISYSEGDDAVVCDDAIVCEDPILTVAVLGRVSRLLYIPRRELGWHACLVGASICFPAKYFPQYCGASGRARSPSAPDNDGTGRARSPSAPKGETT